MPFGISGAATWIVSFCSSFYVLIMSCCCILSSFSFRSVSSIFDDRGLLRSSLLVERS